MASFRVVKLGLYGTPGAGKSTTCGIIAEYCAYQKIPIARIKLADPLYEAQAAIYEIAGQKLDDFYEQDGELLNFLGYYLRKLNPSVLLARFAQNLQKQIDKLSSHTDSVGVVVCDDLRRPDAEFLKSNGFMLLRIIADEQICEQRRTARGDRSLGSAKHVTEQGLDEIMPDLVLENITTIDDLRQKVYQLVGGLINDPDRTSDFTGSSE